MELPQPRPYGSEGKKSTHDFLSLYSPVQQDPRSSQGGYLKTQDFLQPLERVGKNVSKEEDKAEPPSPHVEKSRPPAPPPTSSSSLEHILPGGIGTYSISHISYINERFPKPEGIMVNLAPPAQASSSDRNDENSNCSSYTGSGFTLWDESVVMNKGQTGKENNTAAKERQAVREAGVPVSGQWASSLEHQSQSSSSHTFLNKAFSSLSSSQQSFSKKQSFMDMIKSARNGEDDEDEDDDGFVIKKEPSSYPKGNMTVKVDGKGPDQKPNTPRSKHSATEQRRRSKINDRFQMLRGLIPHSDQKRDKASFLLEVIEYIQFLQEKVHKYEDPYQGWSQEPSKLIPLAKGHRTIEAFADQLGATNFGSSSALVFAKFDETNINISPTMPRVGHPIIEPEIVVDTIKEMDHHRIGLTNKGLPIALPLQQTMNSHKGSSTVAVPLPPHVTSNSEIRTSQPQSQQRQSRFSGTDSTIVTEKVKAQELTIESGTISVSSVYSQGLLNTLTQSLQNSGVDLSQATISVQIDIGNRGNSALNPSISTIKTNTNDISSTNQTMLRPRLASSGAEYDQALKRLKKGRS